MGLLRHPFIGIYGSSADVPDCEDIEIGFKKVCYICKSLEDKHLETVESLLSRDFTDEQPEGYVAWLGRKMGEMVKPESNKEEEEFCAICYENPII